MKKRIAVTGHRTWSNPIEVQTILFEATNDIINDYFDDPILIHGCARGVDLWFGEYAMQHNLELHLYLPFPLKIQIEKGMRTESDIQSLKTQIKYASKVVVVNNDFYTQGYGKRNRILVDNCDVLIVCMNRIRSGTGHAARYARENGIPYYNVIKEQWVGGSDTILTKLFKEKFNERPT